MDNPGLPQGVTSQTISLGIGHPDPATLDTPEFQEAVRRVMASPQVSRTLAYGNEQGNVELIEYLVGRINREQHLSLTAENLMITAGSTSAVDMIARLYTQPGDVVIVEAPSYVDALHVFRDQGVVLHAVPMDDEGMLAGELESLLKQLASKGIKPRLLYTIPNFHNPTGITASEPRRTTIIDLARRYDLMIVEDDVYRDLAFEAEIPPSYLTLAEGVDIIQIGSVSKTIAPGLRVGWIVAASEIVRRCVECGTTQMGGGANPLAAQIVAEYCQQGYWDTHLQNICDLYQARRNTMLAALKQYMSPQVTWTQPLGGFFVWLTLPEKRYGVLVKEEASERGVLVASGGGFFVNPSDGQRNLRLTYSFASLADIDTAIRILAEVIGG
jgi:2-aminoadipate transaminase